MFGFRGAATFLHHGIHVAPPPYDPAMAPAAKPTRAKRDAKDDDEQDLTVQQIQDAYR